MARVVVTFTAWQASFSLIFTDRLFFVDALTGPGVYIRHHRAAPSRPKGEQMDTNTLTTIATAVATTATALARPPSPRKPHPAPWVGTGA